MYTFAGIDHAFIDLIYFRQEQERKEFKQSLQNRLNDLNIQINYTEFRETNDKALKLLGWFPLIFDTFTFNDDHNRGTKKLEHYYTALKFAKFNIERKKENKNFDFSFEEELILKTFTDELKNYARLDTLFFLARLYDELKNYSKRNFYFEIVKSDTYDLASSTVAKFHKQIGDILLANEQRKQALEWYRSGTQFDNKLAVKKIIRSLENES